MKQVDVNEAGKRELVLLVFVDRSYLSVPVQWLIQFTLDTAS